MPVEGPSPPSTSALLAQTSKPAPVTTLAESEALEEERLKKKLKAVRDRDREVGPELGRLVSERKARERRSRQSHLLKTERMRAKKQAEAAGEMGGIVAFKFSTAGRSSFR